MSSDLISNSEFEFNHLFCIALQIPLVSNQQTKALRLDVFAISFLTFAMNSGDMISTKRLPETFENTTF